MTKFKIEISKAYRILIYLEILLIVAMSVFFITVSFSLKSTYLLLCSFFFLGFTVVSISVLTENIVISDTFLSCKIANFTTKRVPLSDILVVRFKNKKDFIPRGNPVLSKNVIAIEYMNKKRKRNMLYFSISRKDAEGIIRLLVKYGCNFEINNPQLYK